MLVAGDAQIVSLANVSAEFKRVVPLDFSPIIDELDLIFVLDQRTVAAIHAESVTELEQIVAVIVDEERRHPAGECLIKVQAGNTGIASGRGINAVWYHMYLIAEEAETEIGEQIRLQSVIETGRDTMICEVD